MLHAPARSRKSGSARPPAQLSPLQKYIRARWPDGARPAAGPVQAEAAFAAIPLADPDDAPPPAAVWSFNPTTPAPVPKPDDGEPVTRGEVRRAVRQVVAWVRRSTARRVATGQRETATTIGKLAARVADLERRSNRMGV